MTDILDQIDEAIETPEVSGPVITRVEAREIRPEELSSFDVAEYAKINGDLSGITVNMSAAALKRASGVESMVSNRVTPWHENATVIFEDLDLGSKLDTRKALKLMGADFKVGSKPLFDEKGNVIPGFMASTRLDTGDVYGIVSPSYTHVQNEETCEAADEILGGLGAILETGGIFSDGTTWVQARVPDALVIAGDIHYPLLTISNGHDGKTSCSGNLGMIFARCRNSFRLGKKTAPATFSFRHSKNVRERLSFAGSVLGLYDAYVKAFESEVDSLVNRTVSAVEFDSLLADLFPVADDATDRQKAKVAGLRGAVRMLGETDTDGGGDFAGTAWGFLNAVNSFDLWASENRGKVSRGAKTLHSVIDGHEPSKLTTKARMVLAKR